MPDALDDQEHVKLVLETARRLHHTSDRDSLDAVLRPYVQLFALAMEYKLARHDSDREDSYQDMTPEQLEELLLRYIIQLRHTPLQDLRGIVLSAANLANAAMFVAVNAGLFDWPGEDTPAADDLDQFRAEWRGHRADCGDCEKRQPWCVAGASMLARYLAAATK